MHLSDAFQHAQTCWGKNAQCHVHFEHAIAGSCSEHAGPVAHSKTIRHAGPQPLSVEP